MKEKFWIENRKNLLASVIVNWSWPEKVKILDIRYGNSYSSDNHYFETNDDFYELIELIYLEISTIFSIGFQGEIHES